ncbi:TRAP transporter substrate-binding protein DctP [Thermodesulfobacteriota bacterium]
MTKAIRSLAAFSAAALLFVLLAPSISAADNYTFKMATLPPRGSQYMNIMEAFAEELKTRSDGQIKIQFYPGGQMGDERDYIRKMRSMLDGAGFSGMGLGDLLHSSRILEMPFTFKNYGEYEAVRTAVVPTLNRRFEEKGYKILGWAEQGFIRLCSNSPIHSIADVKKTKCWAWAGDPLAASIYDNFNLTPVPVAVPEVLTSLQTGIIETIYSAPNILIALQWFTRIKYIIDVPMVYAGGAILVKKSAFDRLPPELQALVEKMMAKYITELNDLTHKENEEAMNVLQGSHGIELIKIDAEKLAEWDVVGEQIRQANIGKIWDQEILDMAMTALAEHRNGLAGTPAEGTGE